jgi:hypothetical protein
MPQGAARARTKSLVASFSSEKEEVLSVERMNQETFLSSLPGHAWTLA